jgi:hypothetical protein
MAEIAARSQYRTTTSLDVNACAFNTWSVGSTSDTDFILKQFEREQRVDNSMQFANVISRDFSGECTEINHSLFLFRNCFRYSRRYQYCDE